MSTSFEISSPEKVDWHVVPSILKLGELGQLLANLLTTREVVSVQVQSCEQLHRLLTSSQDTKVRFFRTLLQESLHGPLLAPSLASKSSSILHSPASVLASLGATTTTPAASRPRPGIHAYFRALHILGERVAAMSASEVTAYLAFLKMNAEVEVGLSRQKVDGYAAEEGSGLAQAVVAALRSGVDREATLPDVDFSAPQVSQIVDTLPLPQLLLEPPSVFPMGDVLDLILHYLHYRAFVVEFLSCEGARYLLDVIFGRFSDSVKFRTVTALVGLLQKQKFSILLTRDTVRTLAQMFTSADRSLVATASSLITHCASYNSSPELQQHNLTMMEQSEIVRAMVASLRGSWDPTSGPPTASEQAAMERLLEAFLALMDADHGRFVGWLLQPFAEMSNSSHSYKSPTAAASTRPLLTPSAAAAAVAAISPSFTANARVFSTKIYVAGIRMCSSHHDDDDNEPLFQDFFYTTSAAPATTTSSSSSSSVSSRNGVFLIAFLMCNAFNLRVMVTCATLLSRTLTPLSHVGSGAVFEVVLKLFSTSATVSEAVYGLAAEALKSIILAEESEESVEAHVAQLAHSPALPRVLSLTQSSSSSSNTSSSHGHSSRTAVQALSLLALALASGRVKYFSPAHCSEVVVAMCDIINSVAKAPPTKWSWDAQRGVVVLCLQHSRATIQARSRAGGDGGAAEGGRRAGVPR